MNSAFSAYSNASKCIAAPRARLTLRARPDQLFRQWFQIISANGAISLLAWRNAQGLGKYKAISAESAIHSLYNLRTFLRKTSMMSCTSLMRSRNAAPKNPAPATAIVTSSIANFWKNRISDHASSQR